MLSKRLRDEDLSYYLHQYTQAQHTPGVGPGNGRQCICAPGYGAHLCPAHYDPSRNVVAVAVVVTPPLSPTGGTFRPNVSLNATC